MAFPLTEKLLQIRLVRFALTGGLATMVHIIVAFLCLHSLQATVFVANIAGFISAFLFSYLLQSLFVFRKKLSLSNALRFFMVQFCALLVAQLISELFQDTNSYLRVLLVVFMIPAVTYIIHKFWTYSDKSD